MIRFNTQKWKSGELAVVVTGAGLTTSLGLSRHAVWQAILAGRDGIAPLRAVESPLDPNKGGGEAPPIAEADESAQRREVTYLRHVITEALHEAGLESDSPYAAPRCGVILGTTLHGMRSGGRFLRTGDFSHLRGFLAGAVLRGALGSAMARFRGLSVTTCSACSSGLAAISLACSMLQSGELDCVLAGGYDAISEYAYAGFNSMRLVSGGDIRPFARQRDGMKVAEGYGVVILERADDARRRGARALARIAGIGESCDSFHLSKPHPQGAGAAHAMTMALSASQKSAELVDLVVAHATATPDNDAAEYAALKQVFGDSLPQIPVVAFKSYFGHTLGGAGAVELICALSAMEEGVCPPCLHVAKEDVAYEGLALSVGEGQRVPLRRVLCTSLGFGGANVAIVLESPKERRNSVPTPFRPSKTVMTGARDVLVAGIGLMLPERLSGRTGLDAPGVADSMSSHAFLVLDDKLEALLHAKRVRRMSRYAKLTLAAATLSLQEAGLPLGDPLEGGGAILATTHGSSAFCEAYYRQIITEGLNAANPLLFSEGVPNVAAAHVSTALGIRGFCQTLIGTRTVGLDALRLAAARIRSGQWSRALVVAAEEYHDVVHAAFRENMSGRRGKGLPLNAPFMTGEGAVALVLESRVSLEARGVQAWGAIVPAASEGGLRLVGPSIIAAPAPSAICAGGRWSWGRSERIAARRVLRDRSVRSRERVHALPDDWPELFSVGPLVALARWLHGTGGEGAAEPEGQVVCVACDHEGFSSTLVCTRACHVQVPCSPS